MKKQIERDFPILTRKINGKRLIYLDNAATSQKPIQVINTISDFYKKHNANIHRSIHTLGNESTELYENSREKVSKFINSKSQEIIFTRSTTESINTIAYSLMKQGTKKGDEIILFIAEHHANIIPWQFLYKFKGVKLKYINLNKDTTLDMKHFGSLLTKNTKLVALTHCSNVTGTINNIKDISKLVHDNKSLFLVDAAQSVPHFKVDSSYADFLAFSGHKMLGPTGIGILSAKEELQEKMEPFLGGGNMIKEVNLLETTYKNAPYKFEAGTPPIADAIGLGAAIDYLNDIGMDNIQSHEKELTTYALKRLQEIKDLKIHGSLDVKKRIGVISFSMEKIHPHDIAAILDTKGIAIRAGHNCAQPLMKFLQVPAVGRASFYLYNKKEDVDMLIDGLLEVKKVFKRK